MVRASALLVRTVGGVAATARAVEARARRVGTSRRGGLGAPDAGAAAAVIGPRQLARARAGQVAAANVGREVLVGHQPPRGREGKATVGKLVVGVAHGLPVALDAFLDPLVPHLLHAAEELVANSLVRRNDAVVPCPPRAAAPAAAGVLCVGRAVAERVMSPSAPTAARDVLEEVTKGLLARALVGTCGLLERQQPCGHVGVVGAVGELECTRAVLVYARHAFGVQLLELAGGEGGGAGDQVVARQAIDESTAPGGKVRRSRVVDAHRVDDMQRGLRHPNGPRTASAKFGGGYIDR